MKKNLHLIDFPKMNTQIKFVSNYEEIKEKTKSAALDFDDGDDEMEQ